VRAGSEPLNVMRASAPWIEAVVDSWVTWMRTRYTCTRGCRDDFTRIMGLVNSSDERSNERRPWTWVARVCGVYALVGFLGYQMWLIATDAIDYSPRVYSSVELLIVLGGLFVFSIAAYRR